MDFPKCFAFSVIGNRIIPVLLFFAVSLGQGQNKLLVTGNEASGDICNLLQLNNLEYQYVPSIQEAIRSAKRNSGIYVLSSTKNGGTVLSERDLKAVRKKGLRLFMDFPEEFPGLSFVSKKLQINKERGVWTSDQVAGIEPMDILSLNTRELLLLEHPDKVSEKDVLAVLAKVAGFDTAEYGIDNIPHYPLLFQFGEDVMLSTAPFSTAMTARNGPTETWTRVFEHIFGWLLDNPVELNSYPVSVKPFFEKREPLPDVALSQAIIRGTDWFFNAKLLVHPTWEHLYYKNTAKNGKEVVHAPVGDTVPLGNGSLGILEGHASRINPDGSQPYRWWIRADCQAETAYAMTTAYAYDPKNEYLNTAKNLLNNLFINSNLRAGERNDPESPSFGLIGWATTDPDAYYGDDNARLLLSLIGASTNMGLHDWDDKLLEGILGNFRTAGTKGFRGPWFRDAGMQETTWQQLGQRDIVNVHPHYESWLWALYLWLYDKTGEEALYNKAQQAISITMNTHLNWKWTNGITQEYARMVLPLAWLVRVKDTPQHRQWLDLVVKELLKGFDESGAITERLGTPGLGRYEKIKSNEEYGTKEAPLISSESDKVADLLYTMNFSLFSLNEAAQATQETRYANAAEKVAEFLVRTQIKSREHQDLEGGWFRAFDVEGWEYWASNADSDWGPWGTLTGWTQSWIINGLANEDKEQSLWESSRQHYSNTGFQKLSKKKINQMLNQ